MSLPDPKQRRRHDLERELAGVIAEFEVMDRDLFVRESLAIDWVGFDADGVLVLVLWTEGRGAGVVLDVLDALAFVRAHLDVLARHWKIEPTAPRPPALHDDPIPRDPRATPVRAVCLADHFDGEALERLGVWSGQALDLFEVRTVRSEMGEGAYLVPVRERSSEPAVETPRASFLDGVSEDHHALACVFLARMARLDAGLERVEDAGAADWFYAGERLGALRARETRLEASLPGFAAPLDLRSEHDVDEFIDRALARLVDLSCDSEPDPDDDEFPEIDEATDLAQVELIPMDSGALLTPEEIEAFHG